MIVVNGIIESSSEDIATLKEMLIEMETVTRQETGCLDYAFSTEMANPQILRLTEKWDTLESLQAHFTMPHLQAFQEAIVARPPKRTDISFYRVEELDLM